MTVVQPVVVKEETVTLLDWPTNVASIDYGGEEPHTVLLFVPGNPGLYQWYLPLLLRIIQQLGPGYAARACSYAGHGMTREVVEVEEHTGGRNVDICWTIQGQVEHKIAWLDWLQLGLQSSSSLKLIFISHSIGAHLVHRLLVLSEKWRHQTVLIVHWMPFIRMDAHTTQQVQLNFVARRPMPIIRGAQALLRNVSAGMLDTLMSTTVPDKEGRKIAVDLLSHPTFCRNFLELGAQEIRDLPQVFDLPALRLLNCPIAILYCRNDHWCPLNHRDELLALQGIAPMIHTEYAPNLVHDFIVRPEMIQTAQDFCVRAILRVVRVSQSKL